MTSSRGKSISTVLAILVSVIGTGVPTASAQSGTRDLKEFVTQVVDIYHTVIGNKGYDSTFIAHPETKLVVTPRAIANGFGIYNNNTSGDVAYDAFKSSRRKLSLGADVGFSGLSAGFGVNPLKQNSSKRYRDHFYTFNFYGNRFCADALYEDNRSLDGTLRRQGEWTPLPEGVISHKSISVNGYYVFNWERFSYPAAFTQSFIQKKSAGSLLGAVTYTGSRFRINPWELLDSETTEAGINILCLGAGYGYNLVTPHSWTIHISAIPAMGWFMPQASASLLAGTITGRVAVVKNFARDRIYASFSAYEVGLLAFESTRFSYGQMLWDARFRLGFRF